MYTTFSLQIGLKEMPTGKPFWHDARSAVGEAIERTDYLSLLNKDNFSHTHCIYYSH